MGGRLFRQGTYPVPDRGRGDHDHVTGLGNQSCGRSATVGRSRVGPIGGSVWFAVTVASGKGMGPGGRAKIFRPFRSSLVVAPGVGNGRKAPLAKRPAVLRLAEGLPLFHSWACCVRLAIYCPRSLWSSVGICDRNLTRSYIRSGFSFQHIYPFFERRNASSAKNKRTIGR